MFFLPIFSLPFDQQTLLGYFGEEALSIFTAEFYLIVNGSILLLFIGICLHHQAFFKIFHHGVSKLNHFHEDQNDEQLLCELVQFHILAKECVQILSSYHFSQLNFGKIQKYQTNSEIFKEIQKISKNSENLKKTRKIPKNQKISEKNPKFK